MTTRCRYRKNLYYVTTGNLSYHWRKYKTQCTGIQPALGASGVAHSDKNGRRWDHMFRDNVAGFSRQGLVSFVNRTRSHPNGKQPDFSLLRFVLALSTPPRPRKGVITPNSISAM